MASEVDGCWRCGVQWAREEQPRPTLRLLAGGADEHARPDVERWTKEGGSFRSDVAVARRAAVSR
jgi:hypothetical protein